MKDARKRIDSAFSSSNDPEKSFAEMRATLLGDRDPSGISAGTYTSSILSERSESLYSDSPEE
jgi:hypothetical protein